MIASDHQISCAFGQGQSASRKGGYRSDNPYMPEAQQELYQAWLEGFEYDEGPSYVASKKRPWVVPITLPIVAGSAQPSDFKPENEG